MIDTRSLIELLPRQRWFGGKERTISVIDLVDEATLVEGDESLVFAIVSVRFADGPTQLYSLSLLVDAEGRGRDACEAMGRLAVIGELMTQGETVKGAHGMFHFGGPGLDPRTPPGHASVRSIGTEQSNTSLVFDEAVIIKLFRRVESGPNPDLELSRLLTSEGFENIPAHVGEILYEGTIDGEELEIDLGVAQQFVTEAREGWSESLRQLRALFDSAGEADEIDEEVSRTTSKGLDEIARLGQVTASLHVLLAREELEPEVVAQPVDEYDVREWAGRAESWLRRLLEDGASQLEIHKEAIQDRIDRLSTLEDVGLKTRIHGDYHLGQVMLVTRGWLILDFEGEPARTIEERRTKQSPLVDVAGMLRSFNYASSAALFERAEPGSEEWDRLQPWADSWERAARNRFLSSYLRTSHEGEFLPAERGDLAVMLDAFEIEKALYELAYERAHRPEWARIPLRGIANLLARAESR